MARFQAITTQVVDSELEMLRESLGLEPGQKAELLREMAALAAWIVRQSEEGREIEARAGDQVERLRHPAIERLRRGGGTTRIVLDDREVRELARVLDHGFTPSPALRRTLTRLASPSRKPPRLRWKRRAG